MATSMNLHYDLFRSDRRRGCYRATFLTVQDGAIGSFSARLTAQCRRNLIPSCTRCATSKLLADADVRELRVRMMEEMQLCTQQLDLPMAMLADIEARRQLGLDPQPRAVVEIALASP